MKPKCYASEFYKAIHVPPLVKCEARNAPLVERSVTHTSEARSAQRPVSEAKRNAHFFNASNSSCVFAFIAGFSFTIWRKYSSG